MRIEQRVRAIIAAGAKGVAAAYDAGTHLKAIKDGKEHFKLGYRTLEDFLRGEKLGISKGTCFRLIRLVEEITLKEATSLGIPLSTIFLVLGAPVSERAKLFRMAREGALGREIEIAVIEANARAGRGRPRPNGAASSRSEGDALALAELLDEVLKGVTGCPFCKHFGSHSPTCRAMVEIRRARGLVDVPAKRSYVRRAA